MRVLWLTADRTVRVARIFDQLREEFVKLEPDTEIIAHSRWNWESVKEGGHPKEPYIPASFINEFDFVFTDAIYAYQKIEWSKVVIPKCVLFEDLHSEIPNGYINKARNEFCFNYFFIRYRDAMVRMYPWILTEKAYWLPHNIDQELFYSNGQEHRPIRILLTGRRNQSTYPERGSAYSCLYNVPGFISIPRPPEGELYKWPVGMDYADLLRTAKICTGGGSKYEYPTIKHFEVTACGSVLLMNHFQEMKDLGFDGFSSSVDVNNFNSWKHAALDILSDLDELHKIAINGHDVTINNHTAKIRAKQLRSTLLYIFGKRSRKYGKQLSRIS